MVLVADISMPFIADPRVVCGDEVALELKDLARDARLQRLVVKSHVPDARCRVLTKPRFGLVDKELLAR